MEKLTQSDSDNLADIIWWIRGYIAANEYERKDFSEAHIQSLIKFRKAFILQEELDSKPIETYISKNALPPPPPKKNYK